MSPSRPWQHCYDIVLYFSKMCNCCRSVWVTVFCLKHAIIFATLKSCLRSLSVLLVMCSVRTAVKHALIPDSMQGLRLWVHFAADAPFLIIIVVPSWVQRGKIPLSCIGLWIGILDDKRWHCNQHHHDKTRWQPLLKTQTSFTTRACAAQQTIESSMDNQWEGKFIINIFIILPNFGGFSWSNYQLHY